MNRMIVRVSGTVSQSLPILGRLVAALGMGRVWRKVILLFLR